MSRIAVQIGFGEEIFFDSYEDAEKALRPQYTLNGGNSNCHGRAFLDALPNCLYRELDSDTDTMIAEMPTSSSLRIPYGYDIDITPRTSPRYEYTENNGDRIWVQYFDGVGDPGGMRHDICLYYKESPDYDGHNPETAIDRREPEMAIIDGTIYKF